MTKPFNTKEAMALSVGDLERLKVTGLGTEVSRKFTACGAAQEAVTAGVVISIRDSKIQSARWMVTGNLGEVGVSTHRLAGSGARG